MERGIHSQLDPSGQVQNWLDNLDIEDATKKTTDESQTYEPQTPPKNPISLEQKHCSPADTTCTTGVVSIFDRDLQGRRDTATADNDQISHIQRRHTTLPVHNLNGGINTLATITYEDANADTEAPSPHLPPPQRPDGKVLIHIVSCLQCTLAGLRCSRTLPACSRCIRHGQAGWCLLQRRRLIHEIPAAGSVERNTPVFLGVLGEEKARRVVDEEDEDNERDREEEEKEEGEKDDDDDEEKGMQKQNLAHQLLRDFAQVRERDNWVLPHLVDTERRGFACWRGGAAVATATVAAAADRLSDVLLLCHPGEGRGNVGEKDTAKWVRLA